MGYKVQRGRRCRGRLHKRVVSPQGKRLIMICASLALLHPLLSLTHWIFRSLMLPYKSSSHSANHVRYASLRSGGDSACGAEGGGLPYGR